MRASHLSPQAGISLVELMITLTVVGLLAMAVAPSVQHILISNRLAANINETSALAQLARVMAVDEQADVVLCPTENFSTCTNDWEQSKMVFVDINGNGVKEAAETLVRASNPLHDTLRMQGPAVVVRFNAIGILASPASLQICHQSMAPKYARAIFLSLQGRLSLSRDNDGDGVHEDNSGTTLSCL